MQQQKRHTSLSPTKPQLPPWSIDLTTLTTVRGLQKEKKKTSNSLENVFQLLQKSNASRSAWSLQVTRGDKVTTSSSSAHKHLIVCQIELAGEVLKGSHLSSLFFPFLRDLMKGCLLGENPSHALISTAAWQALEPSHPKAESLGTVSWVWSLSLGRHSTAPG